MVSNVCGGNQVRSTKISVTFQIFIFCLEFIGVFKR